MNATHRSAFARHTTVILILTALSGVAVVARPGTTLQNAAPPILPVATDLFGPSWWFWAFALGMAVGCAIASYILGVSRLRRRRLEIEVVQRRQTEEALRARHRRIQDLAARLITAQEAERRRIARDLHDGVCQDIAAISVDMSHLRQKKGDIQGREVQELLVSVQRRALTVTESLRLMSHGLHPSILHHVGLVAALQADCLEIERQHDMRVKLVADGLVEPDNRVTALALFRIAQEALRNSARHGRARHATVSLARDGSHLTLTIADNGEGFDVETVRQSGGLGVVCIEERARMARGQATIQSEPGFGTRITVRVPCTSAETAPGWQSDYHHQEQFVKPTTTSFVDYR